MKRIVLSLLAALGVLAALAVTSFSTSDQAYGVGMRGIALAGLVVLLEVINVAGTWVWLTDVRRNVRIEAAVGVGVASLVTGACGWVSFHGPLGVVAPAGLLFAVHLVFRLNQPAPVQTANRTTVPLTVRTTPTNHATTEPPNQEAGPDQTAPVTVVATEPDQVSDTPGPVQTPTEPVRTTGWSDREIVDDLRAKGIAEPTGQYIRQTYGCGKPKADRVIERLAAKPLAAVV